MKSNNLPAVPADILFDQFLKNQQKTQHSDSWENACGMCVCVCVFVCVCFRWGRELGVVVHLW